MIGMHSMQLLHADDDIGLTKLFGRHFVSIIVYGKWPTGEPLTASYSAFVFAAGERWFLLTAGHNIANWKEAVDKGAIIRGCDLNDAFAGGPHDRTLPIDTRSDDWLTIYDPKDPSGLDLACAPLADFHRLALAANGIVPLELGVDFRRLSRTPCAHLYVTGVPVETTSIKANRLHQNLCVIPAFGLHDQSVSPALRHELKRHYGSIHLPGWTSSGLANIDGMSGGPVFGIWQDQATQTFDYAAIGIQSGWDASAKQIAATPLDAISRAIAELFGE